MNHPFIPPPEDQGIRLVGRSKKALKIIAECGIDLLLAGHLHHGYSIVSLYLFEHGTALALPKKTGQSIAKRLKNTIYQISDWRSQMSDLKSEIANL